MTGARTFVLALALLAFGAGAAAAARLEVTVTNVRAAKGTVRVSLCTEAEFLGDTCSFDATAPATMPETTVVFPDVPPGAYAAQGYLDENDNHEVDRTLLGIPEEGVLFSRDPSYTFSAPGFADTAFTVGPTGTRLTTRLRYWD